jgi:integrase
MRTRTIPIDKLDFILAAMREENRLAIEIELATGLRIGDVLSLKRSDLVKDRVTVKESKTGKSKRVHIPQRIRNALFSRSVGSPWAFPGQRDKMRHRTRQAVYMDIKRVARALRLKGIGTHSARKAYAVKAYNRLQSVEKVQKLLNHGSAEVTLLYALADKL